MGSAILTSRCSVCRCAGKSVPAESLEPGEMSASKPSYQPGSDWLASRSWDYLLPLRDDIVETVRALDDIRTCIQSAEVTFLVIHPNEFVPSK